MQDENRVNKTLTIYCTLLLLMGFVLSYDNFTLIDAIYLLIVTYYFIKIKIVLKKSRK